MRGYGPSIEQIPSPGAARRPLPMGEVKKSPRPWRTQFDLISLHSNYTGTFSSFCRQRATLTSVGMSVSGKLVFQSVTPTSPT
ncbi:hypothetical protein ACVJGD_004914 [Bradyrhizobium sp. USDA 10063]